MFGDLSQLGAMKEKLDSVSPTLCLAKWKHVSIHLLNGRTHSCYLPPSHKIPLDELERNSTALHNTNFKKSQRKLMREGQRPEECNICWSVEDLRGEQISDRLYRAVDSWTMPYFDAVKDAPWDADVNPSYVEVSFSDRCNFKCSYCSPHVSSAWLEETKKQGGYQLAGYVHQDLDYFERHDLLAIPPGKPNPYLEAFWRWWPSLVKDLMFFRITGGEPLLSEHTFRVLDWLAENPQPNLELSINSNLGVPNKYIERFFAAVIPLVRDKKVRHFMLHTSVDTFGAQAEYARHGLHFDRFDANVRRYLREFPTGQLAFMCTFNVLSVTGFASFLEWVLELRREYNNEHRAVLLDIPHLTGPRPFSAKMLPNSYQRQMEKHILWMRNHRDDLPAHGTNGIRQAEVEKMCRILEWMRSPNESGWIEMARKDFYLFFREHDRRRGTDFLGTFPEMAEFWETCRKLVEG